jgi:hypothetical protein
MKNKCMSFRFVILKEMLNSSPASKNTNTVRREGACDEEELRSEDLVFI